MMLTDYLRAEKETHGAFARRIGVHAVTVSKWASGAMRPSWANLAEIQKATEGKVSPADFMNQETV